MKLFICLLFSFALIAQDSVTYHLNKGKALAAQKQWDAAQKEFHLALSDTEPGPETAKVDLARAQAYRDEGKIDEALDWYRASLKEEKSDQVEKEMMDVELKRFGKEVPATAIKGAFEVSPVNRSPFVADADGGNSIDLEVLFGFNDATLSAEGKSQVHQLALAMSSDEFKGRRFRITGHTDYIGDDKTNLKLSLERAKSVRAALEAEIHLTDEMLAVDGKGKSQPKYTAHTDDARRLNRRVQVTLLD